MAKERGILQYCMVGGFKKVVQADIPIELTPEAHLEATRSFYKGEIHN